MRNDLHLEEFKVRLRHDDGALIRAIAQKTGVPAAVLIRQWVLRELEHYHLPPNVARSTANGRSR